MTKSELVDQVADRADLTKQDASRAVDAVLATVEDALRRGSEVIGFGVRQVPCQRARRAGRGQPAHGRAHPDRRLAGAALHRGQRSEERGEGSLRTARSFGDTLAARVAERESQIVLGLDPDPGALWPGDGAAVAAELAGAGGRRAVLEHCRALIDAAAPACVAVKPQLARFEAARRGRLGGAGSGRRARARPGLLVIADGKRGDIDVTAQRVRGAR